jgi:hypothetical protein
MMFAGFSLFAQTKPEIFFFFEPITGISINLKDNELIARMLTNEIRARNCALVETPHGADFILSGTIDSSYYKSEYGRDETIYKDETPAVTYSYNTTLYDSGEYVYLFRLTLRNVKTYEMILQQNLYYSSLDDVYNFFPLLVYNLFSYISDTYAYKLSPEIPPPEPQSVEKVKNPVAEKANDTEAWKNQWLYVRLSFDFPITFYKLRGDGLIDGIGIYNGDYDNPGGISSLDNKVVALPAGTLGFELQFFNWCSIEPKVQAGWESLNDVNYFSLSMGLELKFPIKMIRNVLLEPYGAVSFPIPMPGITKFFDSYPTAAVGGGFQFGLKGGKSGVIFIDANYMYYLGDAGMKNTYGEMYPNPAVIHYRRSVIGLGLGYKFGVFNWK